MRHRLDYSQMGQKLTELGARFQGPGEERSSLEPGPVSYTHLDVYKRQVLRVVEDPDLVLTGYRGSVIAVRGYGRDRYLMVIYREMSLSDGFVITAYFAGTVDRKKAIWKR